VALLTVAMLYNFIAKHHKSDVVQTVSAAVLLQYRLLIRGEEGEGSKLQLKEIKQ